ncbi:MAG TPA: hypothetical protein VNI20_11440 [Fimbriimonadaceae bacterium]|nr:hypothetical protein [Fimbriimonadaceae bacterium]
MIFVIDELDRKYGVFDRSAEEILFDEHLTHINIDEQAARARISAADEMIKRYIQVMEDAIERQVIRPKIDEMRNILTNKGFNVGSVQRTEIRGVNRTAMMVDVGASASVDLSAKIDLINSAQQLAAMTSAMTGAHPLKALGSFDKKDESPEAEYYGIGSGGTFRVVPVFEPSGQAVRFHFQYLQDTIVREPDGSTRMALPRVDHHSIDTEVELNNFELGEISSFEVNTKLGGHEVKHGGIPLLNSIPVLNELPIIGWFSKTNGHAAVVQHSIILGQTVTYPTIVDLMTLLQNGSIKIGKD